MQLKFIIKYKKFHYIVIIFKHFLFKNIKITYIINLKEFL